MSFYSSKFRFPILFYFLITMLFLLLVIGERNQIHLVQILKYCLDRCVVTQIKQNCDNYNFKNNEACSK